MPIFDHAHPMLITAALSFPEFVSVHKISVYSTNSFQRYSQFWSPVTGVTTPIFHQTHPNIFQSIFSFHEFVSTSKKSCISSFSSTDTFDLKIPQSNQPKVFWDISQEPDFSQIWDLCRNIANNKDFHSRSNS